MREIQSFGGGDLQKISIFNRLFRLRLVCIVPRRVVSSERVSAPDEVDIADHVQ